MNLFAYGSLMYPAVWDRVTCQPLTGQAAGLEGFSARRVRGEVYPVLIPDASSHTNGVLYSGVSPAAVERLDQFEGKFYRRVEIVVQVTDGAEVRAWVYVAADPGHPDILPETWDADGFASKSLTTFLAGDPGFSGSRDATS